MSFALPAIILLLIVLPGVFFRYTYRKGYWRSPVVFDTVLNEFAASIVISLVIQLIVYSLLRTLHLTYDFSSALTFITGYYTQENYLQSVNKIADQYIHILVYFIGINSIAALMGFLLHVCVRFLFLDLRFAVFRFRNEWYYLFSGEETIIDSLKGRYSALERLFIRPRNIRWILNSLFVFVSVVITQGSTTYIYAGVLGDWYYDKQGMLEKIVLLWARRRNIKYDQRGRFTSMSEYEEKRFYPIAGDQLVLDYSKVNTINVDVRYIERVKKGQKVKPKKRARAKKKST